MKAQRAAGLVAVAALAVACERAPGDVQPTAAAARATRRAYDGAPPAIPHQAFGAACTSCHGGETMRIEGVGVAPSSPHGDAMAGALRRCEQCHVYRQTDATFRPSSFVGRAQDLRPGDRAYAGAPPVIPHDVFMRENCAACHTGAAVRREIACTHPERTRCVQCHVPATTGATFTRAQR